jgi:chromosomal replication initiator protein
MIPFANHGISIRQVQETVAQTFHVSAAELVSASRRQRVTCARHVAMYLSRELAGPRDPACAAGRRRPSFPRIGMAFARDHSSVIHACQMVERRRIADHGFARLLERLAGEVHVRAGTAAQTHRWEAA